MGALPENQNAVTITDDRVLDSFQELPPDIGAVWELCLHREWDRAKTVEGIADWLGEPGQQSILDCACGSGFPGIDLAQRGYKITCTDGSARMLEYFRRNAALAKVDLAPQHARWSELPGLFGGAFDVVMCRGGGSLIYAGAWDECRAPDRHSIWETIQQLVGCLRPGGRLYVDITRAEDLARQEPQLVRHPPYLIGGRTVELEELTTVDRGSHTRQWHSQLRIDGVLYEFTRRSHYLAHEELTVMLQKAGLTEIRQEDVPGETYAVFTARLPEA